MTILRFVSNGFALVWHSHSRCDATLEGETDLSCSFFEAVCSSMPSTNPPGSMFGRRLSPLSGRHGANGNGDAVSHSLYKEPLKATGTKEATADFFRLRRVRELLHEFTMELALVQPEDPRRYIYEKLSAQYANQVAPEHGRETRDTLPTKNLQSPAMAPVQEKGGKPPPGFSGGHVQQEQHQHSDTRTAAAHHGAHDLPAAAAVQKSGSDGAPAGMAPKGSRKWRELEALAEIKGSRKWRELGALAATGSNPFRESKMHSTLLAWSSLRLNGHSLTETLKRDDRDSSGDISFDEFRDAVRSHMPTAQNAEDVAPKIPAQGSADDGDLREVFRTVAGEQPSITIGDLQAHIEMAEARQHLADWLQELNLFEVLARHLLPDNHSLTREPGGGCGDIDPISALARCLTYPR